ncbi:MAG TPA: PepSY-associated TM helix domain-containing protein [Bryobacteraceae bacterium]|jgi:hypothetical protein
MYRILRNTHLFLGLFCCLFLLMYGVSAVQMSHNRWFNLRPTVTTTDAALPPNSADARLIARELMDRYTVRGEVSQVRVAPARVSFSIVRPGTVYQIDYNPATGRTQIRDNHAGFMGMLNRIHHIGGLWHDYWLTELWAAFVAVVSIALVVLAITGIYLWFKIHRERVIGAILLALSLGYSLSLIVLARSAG